MANGRETATTLDWHSIAKTIVILGILEVFVVPVVSVVAVVAVAVVATATHCLSVPH